MDKNVMRNLRLATRNSVVAAAVCALLSAIGALITANILIGGDFESSEGANVCSVFLIAFWDITRLGGFGMFVGGVLSVAFEIFGRDRNKVYSFVMLGGSIFGFIGSIILSIQSILKSTIMPMTTYSYPSEADIAGSFISTVNTACVFIIVSAVVVFVAVGISKASEVNANMYYSAQMPDAIGGNAEKSDVWYCKNCNTQNSNSSAVCRNCGKYK